MALEDDHPNWTAETELNAPGEIRWHLIALLQEYKDVFDCKPAEMLDINPAVIEHHQNVDLLCKPMAQKKRHIGAEQYTTATEEVQRLLEAGFIQEC